MKIHILESRALIHACLTASSLSICRDRHVLFLVDSMVVCLSFGRSRARFYDLLVLIRRFKALCVVAGVMPHCRWVASEMNPADGPSREFEPPMLSS